MQVIKHVLAAQFSGKDSLSKPVLTFHMKHPDVMPVVARP